MQHGLPARPDDIERMTRALGWRPTEGRLATTDRGTGAMAARWIVADGAGRSAFVKIGATDVTAEWIRTEYRNYQALRGWFLPEVRGWDDDGARPTLAIEDLSDAVWPPPWTDTGVEAVMDAFAAIAMAPVPAHLESRPFDRDDWQAVAANPSPFLALGLCSAEWLEAALPVLDDATHRAPLDGDALVHLDVRSDNLCFRDGRAVIIDWNHATPANPDLDVAFFLPSLHAEGGPAPDALLPDAPGLAAWVAGFFCSRAGDPPILDALHVRPLQIMQSRTALPWAARALGLPPPDGIDAEVVAT
jgi:hypothetical protein